MKKLFAECLAEVIGTMILVFFGCGSVIAAVITKAFSGLWQVAVVWGFAVCIAIYTTSAISGAHINPAVTIAMSLFRRKEFPARKVAPYIAAQVLGAFLGAAILYLLFQGSIAHYENINNIVRGESGSQLSAMIFGEYFPNPAIYGITQESFSQVPLYNACLAELIGTALLLFFIFTITDKNISSSPKGERRIPAYFFIGFIVAILISILAPLTQAGLNPARDFGPRLFSYMAGWGNIAIPGPRGGVFLVYILSPILGAIIGGFFYKGLCSRLYAIAGDNTRSVPPA